MTLFRLWLALCFGTSLLLIPALPSTAVAALPDAVQQDFAPIDGYIIMPVGNEYLVDMDASKGVHPGDLLSVTQPGEKIVHPITGEFIGTLDKKLAILSITQIKTGYSYAKVVSGEKKLSKGTAIKRFTGLSARLRGESAAAADIYQQLTAALPALDWQGLSTSTTDNNPVPTDLLFTLTDSQLEVRNAAGHLIQSYPTNITINTTFKAPTHAADQVVEVQPLAKLDLPTPVAWEKKTQAKPTGSISYDRNKSDENLIGNIKAAILMADFINTNDGLLLATTDGSTVQVFRVSDSLLPIAEYTFGTRTIHSLSWWQPTPDSLYLAANGSSEGPPTASTSTETNPSSGILRLTKEGLTPTDLNVGYFLGSLDSDGDGRRETLLGQSLDLDIFYGQTVQLLLKQNKIVSTAVSFKIPRPFPVQSSLRADFTGDGSLETVTLAKGLLTIYRGSKTLYQSKKELGGSISQLTYDTNPGQIDALFTTASFEVAPVSADIDGDGRLELIAVSSDHPVIISPGSGSNISETWLSVFKFQDGRFIKGRVGSTFDRPIQGLYATKDKLIILTTGHTGNGNSGDDSQVLSLTLRTNQ